MEMKMTYGILIGMVVYALVEAAFYGYSRMGMLAGFAGLFGIIGGLA